MTGARIDRSAGPPAPRLLGWLDDRSDRLSPLVVKEVRQVVRGREFSLSFGASLVAGLVVAFLGAADALAGGTPGRWTFVALMACLGFLGLAVVPLGAFNALRRERVEQTFDLITLTALSSRRIVIGKLMAQAVKLTTLFAAMAPFVAMSFLLGGIDFVTIAISLVLLFMASLWVSALCVFLSALARSRAVSAVLFAGVGIAVLVAAGLAGTAFRVLSMGLFFPGSGGLGVTAPDFWTLAVVTTAWLVTLINLLLLAVNRLSLPTEDSVTPLRLGFLAQLLLMVGWALTFVFEPPGVAEGAGIGLGVLGGVHLVLLAMFAVTESPTVPRRGLLRMESSSPGRRLVRVFGPGGGRGPGSVLLQLAVLVGAISLFPIDEDDRRVLLASYGYLCFFVAVPTLAFRALLPQYATPLRLRVAILVALAAAMALPDLLYYLIRQPEVLSLRFSGRHLMSPAQTLANWRVVEDNGWVSFPLSVGVIGLVALIALVPTGRRRAAQDASISPPRPAPAEGEPGRAGVISTERHLT
jgi:hypothetical protein